jgi:hypothetical protein
MKWEIVVSTDKNKKYEYDSEKKELKLIEER